MAYYTDIGHKDHPFKIWLYQGGKFFVTKEFPANASNSHRSEFLGKGISFEDSFYCGRFETDTLELSVHKGGYNRYTDSIPSVVISHLDKHFPVHYMRIFT